VTAGTNSGIGGVSIGGMASSSGGDGVISIGQDANAGGGGDGLIAIGWGATAAGPNNGAIAIGQNATATAKCIALGDMSNCGTNFVMSYNGNAMQTSVVDVASLPACSGATEGARGGVNNSNAVSFTAGIGTIVAGGGSTHVPVYCDGTNWRIG
jgi:hypothetical protein